MTVRWERRRRRGAAVAAGEEVGDEDEGGEKEEEEEEGGWGEEGRCCDRAKRQQHCLLPLHAHYRLQMGKCSQWHHQLYERRAHTQAE